MKNLSFLSMPPQPGHFYAVGVGPGAPDLLTLRAAFLIKNCDTVISPQAKGSAKSLALEAVRPFLDQQEIIVKNYPMERNKQKTLDRWNQLADEVLSRCDDGKSVVQITLGDPLIFATSAYLMQSLSEKLPADHIHVVPGISAFQVTAGYFGEALTLQEDRLMLMSATDLAAVERALNECETLVLYKVGGCIESIMELLRRNDLLANAKLVSCGEQGSHELHVEDLSCWQVEPLNYMTTMIIRIGSRPWLENQKR